MKPLVRSFEIFIKQIASDGMLVAVCIAPILTACFFRFAIPSIEQMLCGYFNVTSILANYYLLFDLFLSMITPYMFCFASAMVMLTEYDENMSQYTFVTPVGKKGYIISRLLFPAVISFLYSILLMLLFLLTEWTLLMILTICLLTCFLSVIISLLVFSFSHNKIEGMAMAKLSGLVLLGLPVPFFLTSGVQYLFSPMPSFWIAKLSVDQNYLFFLPALVSLLLWFWLFYKKFDHKLN